MIFHDYRCVACGRDYEDVECVNGMQVPKVAAWSCECGGEVRLNLGSRLRKWLRTHSGNNYGKFDPQFGCVVESYSHRKKLLKRMGAEDAGDPVRGVRVDLDDIPAGGTGKGMPSGVIAAESMEELEDLTGGVVKRRDQRRFKDIGIT